MYFLRSTMTPSLHAKVQQLLSNYYATVEQLLETITLLYFKTMTNFEHRNVNRKRFQILQLFKSSSE